MTTHYMSRDEQAKEYACLSGNILRGYTVEAEHSIVLCERGKEWFYSRKRPDERKATQDHGRNRRSWGC